MPTYGAWIRAWQRFLVVLARVWADTKGRRWQRASWARMWNGTFSQRRDLLAAWPGLCVLISGSWPRRVWHVTAPLGSGPSGETPAEAADFIKWDTETAVEDEPDAGHQVYDFKNPEPGDHGFHWSEVDPNWKSWTPETYIPALEHPVAHRGFGKDMAALDRADATVCVLPCGRSAHLEAGYAAGQGKPVIFLLNGPLEPELMYKMGRCVTTIEDVVRCLDDLKTGVHIKRGKCDYCGSKGDVRGTPILADVILKGKMCEACWNATREGGQASEEVDIGPFRGWLQMTSGEVESAIAEVRKPR